MKSSELSFMASPHEVADWRMVLLVAEADDAGLLRALPGRPGELAERLSLDEHAVMVVLAALSRFDLVDVDVEGAYSLGSEAIDADAAAALHHQANALKMWAARLGGRLRGEPSVPTGPPSHPERWLDSMAVQARVTAPASVDACLSRLPDGRSALDLGGGHGEYALELARRGLAVSMQDRPMMIDIARNRGILEPAGVTLFAGDFFETVAPGPFDLVFCSGVTNTFSGARNRELFERVKPSLAPGGSLVIQTSMRDRQPAAALFGVQMLAVGNGGDAHPERLYRQWLAAAGYEVDDVVDLEAGGRSILFASVLQTSRGGPVP